MLKKALVVLAALAALYGAFCVGRFVTSRSALSADDVAAAKEAGLAEGKVLGMKATLNSGSHVYCIHAETPMDGNQMLFCTNSSQNRDAMCAAARQNAESSPELTVLGCPDGTFIADPKVD